MDSVDHVLELQQVSTAVAQRQVDTPHFANFLWYGHHNMESASPPRL